MSKPSPRPLPTTTTDIYPLTNIIMGKKNVLTSLTSLTSEKQLSRVTTSFYISSQINQGWRQFCRFSGQDGCWLIEEALLDYMRAHPLPQVTLQFTKNMSDYSTDLKKDMELTMAKQSLREQVNFIKGVSEKNPPGVRQFLPRLRRAVKTSLKVHNRDEELTSLLESARRFLE